MEVSYGRSGVFYGSSGVLYGRSGVFYGNYGAVQPRCCHIEVKFGG